MAINVFRFCTCLRVLGSFMVLVVLAIVGLSYYALVVVNYGPKLFEGVASLGLSIFVLAIFHLLLVMLLWTYFAVVLTDPGSVPPGWHPSSDEADVEASISSSMSSRVAMISAVGGVGSQAPSVGLEMGALHPTTSPSWAATNVVVGGYGSTAPSVGGMHVAGSERGMRIGGGILGEERVRFCRKCSANKPPRCHHCSVCGRCVLKMDHHCVWVANCVGARNYKFFLLFLAYTLLETTFVSLALLPPFIDFFRGDSLDHSGLPGAVATTFLVFLFNMAFAVSIISFLVMHATLVTSNTTTIEAYGKTSATPWPYDIGCRRNWQQVFGTKKLFWCVPLYSKEDLCLMPALRGLEFPCRTDLFDVQGGESQTSMSTTDPSSVS
ncbi:hypothetical protein CBR_g54185 [Chara braunii]|uniref:S-acyltransferase n=1 Tax=Chara braunii TaxID=69332 RepID=A0A388K760_CHABU|nr:hypothetical protein CBR_g54185 [Chara braunii]|eukprot:GBG65894.1 hypothetical protein CBR_g54185 [Chara braunii]